MIGKKVKTLIRRDDVIIVVHQLELLQIDEIVRDAKLGALKLIERSRHGEIEIIVA